MAEHRHVVGLVFSGPMMVDGKEKHYHMLPGGLMTSTDKDGPKHTHTVGELETSGPLPLLNPENDDPEHDGAAKKKKKRRIKKDKKPSGWGY